MTESRTIHVLIHGRVQGVSFRAWTQHLAELHGLRGWVRNRQDGSVEAVFSGPADLVAVMLKACRQGPAGALVESVETIDGADADLGPPERFEIRRTV
ncbi:acylphosphatase [Microvirga sp. BSC39]|jgi:acylphosphatase|uniref:acylphosphatase n=1 Tax=Microvirga sp. BSC39 TaxID=1549810 RepID=UPI0004E8AF3D|nr:acylphosphatase [Microvirga sp. BSC39]KFG68585.1 acylphosphatase [Microvirga sp. BSC39]